MNRIAPATGASGSGGASIQEIEALFDRKMDEKLSPMQVSIKNLESSMSAIQSNAVTKLELADATQPLKSSIEVLTERVKLLETRPQKNIGGGGNFF